MLGSSLPEDVDVLKLDIPQNATTQTPCVLTKQSRARYYVPIPAKRESLSDRGPVGYEIRYDEEDYEEGTDTYVLLVENKVSVTPLSFDLTSRTDFKRLARLFSED
jgi:5'-nucleotidase